MLRVGHYCIYLQLITLLFNMYIVVNHMFRLIMVAIIMEIVDTEKHFGIEYAFESAVFLRMAMTISRNALEK